MLSSGRPSESYRAAATTPKRLLFGKDDLMTQTTKSQTLFFVGLLFLLLVAFGLRVTHLDLFSFWIDEALTPLRTNYTILDIITGRTYIQEAVSQDTHPPLYYLLIYATRPLLGETDFAYRYPSVLLSLLLVPLMYQFVQKLWGRPAAFLAALLTTINPLQIWYAQEARMYTLLVLCGLATSYALWQLLTSDQKWWRWLVVYGGAAGLTLYTHYTAVFLLGSHLLLWSWWLWQAGYKKQIAAVSVALLLATIPLAPLTIPRLFTGAETGYTYLPPWLIAQDVVRGFALGIVLPPAGWLQTLFLAIFAPVLLASAFFLPRSTPRFFTLAFLWFYLSAPAVGLALGSLLKPMYQGVRHIMLGSPAFVVLVVGVLVVLWQRGRVGQLLSTALLALLLVASVWSLTEFYTNPAVGKDHVRSLVQFIEAEAGQNDVVIYNDAILMLIHWHYQTRPDVTVTALPVYPHVANEATAQTLAELSQQYDRVWFIPSLPTDNRDNSQLVRQWVRSRLTLIEERFFTGRSTELKVEIYRAGAQPAVPDPLATASNNAFPQLQQATIAEINHNRLWLDVWWQGVKPAETAQLVVAFYGPDGREWLRQTRPVWLAAAWAGQELASYKLELLPGLPAGVYELRWQGWDTAQGVALTEWQPLTQVEISRTFDPLRPAGINFGEKLELLEVTPYDEGIKPGHTLPVFLLWRGQAGLENVRYELEVVGENGQTIRQQTARPGAEWLSSWQKGEIRGELASMPIPAEAEPGLYTLRWRVWQGEDVLTGRGASWLPRPAEWVNYGSIMVEPWPLQTELPPLDQVVQAQYGNFATLAGYNLTHSESQLQVELVWQVQERPPENYVVFVHLVDPLTGQIASQRDWFPVDGLRPTRGWRPGEVLIDPYTLDVSHVPPGRYLLNVGMYIPDQFIRVPVMWNGQAQPNDQMQVQEVVIEKK